MSQRRGGGREAGSQKVPPVALSGRSDDFRPGEVSNDVAALLEPRKARKYHNVPVTVDGHRFDSKKEAERYQELAAAEKAGKVFRLEVHPRFPLVVHEQDCGTYIGDFAYISSDGERIVEDVKSAATRKLPIYRLKARMVWALYGMRIQEV